MLVLFTLVGTILIFLYDGIPLWEKRLWRELGVLGVLIGAAAYLNIAAMLGMTTPVNWLEQLLGPIGRMIYK